MRHFLPCGRGLSYIQAPSNCNYARHLSTFSSGKGRSSAGGRGGYQRNGPPGRGRGRGLDPPPVFGTGKSATITVPDHDKIVNGFKKVPTEPGSIPLRSTSGTIGNPVQLRSNYFPMTFTKPLYEYAVKMEPEVRNKEKRRRIYQLLEASKPLKPYQGQMIHDDEKKLITAAELPEPLEIGIDIPHPSGNPTIGKDHHCKVTLKLVRVVDPQEIKGHLEGDPKYATHDIQPTLSVLNVVLGQKSRDAFTVVSQNKTFFPDHVYDLGLCVEARNGYFTSVRALYNYLALNVDLATAVFYKEGNLANAFTEYSRGTGLRPGSTLATKEMNTFFRGRRVDTTYRSFTMQQSIYLVHDKSAREQQFQCDEFGGLISVEEYFQKKYKVILRHPDMPLIDTGTKDRPNYIPAELCTILPDQLFRLKLTAEQTQTILKHSNQRPAAVAQMITTKGLSLLDPNQLQAFGITVGKEMIILPGRVLDPPKLEFSGQNLTVSNALWNLRDMQFKVGADLGEWSAVFINDGGKDDFRASRDHDSVLQHFSDTCRRNGMTANSKPSIVSLTLPPKTQSDPTRQKSIDAIEKAITSTLSPDTSFILFILSNNDPHVHSGVKHLSDCIFDVSSTCVTAEVLGRDFMPFYSNLALKANVKLGGVNHTVASVVPKRLKSLMFVGCDVTHPTPGDVRGTPSIAAVTASDDSTYQHYPASLRLQESKKEMITALNEMMIERLEAYKAKNQDKLPLRILIFRDGVSEGQFAAVLEEELKQVQSAFETFSTPAKPYKPKVTLVIARKRHHTRFFPTVPVQAHQTGNPLSGTVVDRGVTSIFNFDFFLQSHSTLNGSATSTHYTVIYDENDLTADELQVLTNNSSYLYQRATKAVSLVPAAYYADLACERGRCYIHPLLSVKKPGVVDDPDKIYRLAHQIWDKGVGEKLRKTMFYL